ncbi:hypothetical protein Q2415_25675, partial [Escherichia coli]|nr:hypothetical protein [Escherichia coli]
PLALGLVVCVVSDPMPRPFQGEYDSYAIFNGSSTNIRGMLTQIPGGNISGVTYLNMRNYCLAIECSKYD